MADREDNVAVRHSCYDELEEQRVIIEDLEGGTMKLRKKAETYLPKFPAENDKSYELRCSLATLVNYYQKTVDVMSGMVFETDIEVGDDVSPVLKPLVENIDNEGTHLDVFAREVFDEYFDGYVAIVADKPGIDTNSKGEDMDLGIRPYLKYYKASDITNWRYRVNPVSNAMELALIVFRECSEEQVGTFLVEEVTRYKAWMWDGATVMWQLWKEVIVDKKVTYVLEDEAAIEGLSGIPASIVGELGEPPPLMDVALKTIEHFQTYSDYKAIIHKTCVPLLGAKGLQADEAGKIVVSGDKLTLLDENGDLFYTEVAGSSIEKVRQSLLDIREDIALMGLQMLAAETAGVDLTATEALLSNVAETAELRVMAREMQDALERSFGFMAEFVGKPAKDGGSLKLGTAWANIAAKAETANAVAVPPVDGQQGSAMVN